MTVKGGVNLRLFLASARYSEDMDLDGAIEVSAAIRGCLTGLFDDREFTRRLSRFGIRGLDPGEGPNKDTETTFRYKFGVIVGGGIRYPTKVEVSFRARYAADPAVFEAPSRRILDAYGLDAFEVHHYVREAAVRQKLEALAGRREVQARDVFDTHMLVPDTPATEMFDFLAKAIRRERLEQAHARALGVSYSEYRGQVLEFLGDEARSRYGAEAVWDEMRLRVAALIEGIMGRRERG